MATIMACGFFAILAESGVAAGVRRIEAVTGAGAVEWAQHQREALHSIIDALKVNPSQAVEAIEKLQSESKRLAREATELVSAARDNGLFLMEAMWSRFLPSMQRAFETTPTGIVLSITATTPIFVMPLAYLFEHEKPTRYSVIGGMIAVAGVIALVRS